MNDAQLVCPRCGNSMATFARAGIQIDQCSSCRGIFLDRGELEQLVNSENAFYQQPANQPPPAYPPASYPPSEQRSYEHDHDHEHHDYEHHHGHHGRRSFLHELFD